MKQRRSARKRHVLLRDGKGGENVILDYGKFGYNSYQRRSRFGGVSHHCKDGEGQKAGEILLWM